MCCSQLSWSFCESLWLASSVLVSYLFSAGFETTAWCHESFGSGVCLSMDTARSHRRYTKQEYIRSGCQRLVSDEDSKTVKVKQMSDKCSMPCASGRLSHCLSDLPISLLLSASCIHVMHRRARSSSALIARIALVQAGSFCHESLVLVFACQWIQQGATRDKHSRETSDRVVI